MNMSAILRAAALAASTLACASHASAQELKTWRHGIVEAKSDAGFVFMASHNGFAQMTCFPVSGPIVAGKFQFSGTGDSGRWTGKDHEAIEVHGGADCLHPASG